MSADPFRRRPMVDFDHPPGQSLFWRISDAMERLVDQLENHSPVDLFFQKVDRDIAEAERRASAARTTTPTTGATTMSMITDGRNLLLHAAQRLDDLAPGVSGDGDPEELSQLLRAEQLEAEAEGRAAEASNAPTAQEMAASLRAAEEPALQAEQLRQQAREGLETRAANATQNMDSAEGIEGQIRQAAEGTRAGDEMATAAAGIHKAIEESRTSLAGAAAVATEREQTHECLGLIKQAQDHAAAAAGMCGKLRADIDQYAGVL